MRGAEGLRRKGRRARDNRVDALTSAQARGQTDERRQDRRRAERSPDADTDGHEVAYDHGEEHSFSLNGVGPKSLGRA